MKEIKEIKKTKEQTEWQKKVVNAVYSTALRGAVVDVDGNLTASDYLDNTEAGNKIVKAGIFIKNLGKPPFKPGKWTFISVGGSHIHLCDNELNALVVVE